MKQTGKSTILIADDEPDMREVLNDALISQGFDVRLTTNGQEAVLESLRKPPRVVLLDVLMPLMNGMDALGIFKILEPLRRIPVFMLTALKSKEDVIQAMKGGAVDYIAKPFKLKDVAERLRRQMERPPVSLPPVFQYLRYAASSDGAALRLSPQGALDEDSADDLVYLVGALQPLGDVRIELDFEGIQKIKDGLVSQLVKLHDTVAQGKGEMETVHFDPKRYSAATARLIRNIFKPAGTSAAAAPSPIHIPPSMVEDLTRPGLVSKISAFRYDIAFKQDYTLLQFFGDLTPESHSKIQAGFQVATQAGKFVVLRLDGLKAVDQVGMSFIVSCLQELKDRDALQPFVIGKKPYLQEAFRVAKGHPVCGLYERMAEALTACRRAQGRETG